MRCCMESASSSTLWSQPGSAGRSQGIQYILPSHYQVLPGRQAGLGPTLGHQAVNGDQVMEEECDQVESGKERTGICASSFQVFSSLNAIGKCIKKSSLHAERIEGSGNKVIIHPVPCSNSSLKTIVSDLKPQRSGPDLHQLCLGHWDS